MAERRRRDAVDQTELRRLTTELAATAVTVKDLAARLSPIPERFATLSEEVRGLKGAVEGVQKRIEAGDSAFEALRKEQALHGARLDKLEGVAREARSRAWELFVAAFPYLAGAGLLGLGMWIRSIGH